MINQTTNIKIFQYSDAHFHPININFMDEKGIHKGYEAQCNWQTIWNSTVNPQDIVLVSGDIIWGRSYKNAKNVLNVMEQLPGKKIVINGNHDQWFNSNNIRLNYNTIIPITDCWYNIKNLLIIGSKGESIWKKKYYTKSRYYKKLADRLRCVSSINDLGNYIKILVLHFPPETPRMIQLIKKYKFDVVVYGHQHGKPNSMSIENKTIFVQSLLENSSFIPFHIKPIIFNDKTQLFKIDRRLA